MNLLFFEHLECFVLWASSIAHCVDTGLRGFGGVSLGRALPALAKPQVLRFALRIKITALVGASLNVITYRQQK